MRTATIPPRQPSDGASVSKAERLLGLDDAHRPVYAYVGRLEPDLGSIGLIISRDWFVAAPHGVTRCDTGGLAGRKGGFACLSETEADEALVTLSFSAAEPWEKQLDAEVDSAHASWNSYLNGATPQSVDRLGNVRHRSVAHAENTGCLDPRLWIWEARSFAHVDGDHIEAVAITSESLKHLRRRWPKTAAFPARRLLAGSPDPTGIHHFAEAAVVRAFRGGTL